MQPLFVYISASCAVCVRTQQLVAAVRAQRPDYTIELVDLDQVGAVKPAFVFGTPTYVLGGRIVALGNPALAQLLEILDHTAMGEVRRF